jgi:hypothetical protein
MREILHRAPEAAGSEPAQTDAELQEALSGRTAEEDKIHLHDGTKREIPPSPGRRSTRVEILRQKEKTHGEERGNHQLLPHGAVCEPDI